MIGHVFASSGAVCLALAPSTHRPDEYVLLVKTENGYAIADILTRDLAEPSGPSSWMRAAYFDRDENDLTEAVESFAKATGRDDVVWLAKAVRHAEQLFGDRVLAVVD